METAGWTFQGLHHQPSALVVCSCCPRAFSTDVIFKIALYLLYESLLNLYQKWENSTTKWSVTLSELWENLITVKVFSQQLRHFWQVPTTILKWNNEFLPKISFLVSPLQLKESYCSSYVCGWINKHHWMGMKDTIFKCISK